MTNEIKFLTFEQAMREVIDEKEITRFEWQDNDEYGLLKDGLLMIHTRGNFHQWIISEADMIATDWVVRK